MDFAKSHWENTPENLGVDDCVCDTIQGCQTIGLQLDEMSSFSGNRKNTDNSKPYGKSSTKKLF